MKLRRQLFLVLCMLLSHLVFIPLTHGASGDENWSAQFAPNGFDAPVLATVKDAAGNVYAAGKFTNVDGLPANRIAVWDGNNWSAMGAGFNGNVTTLAINSDGDLYAGGGFTNAGGDMHADHVAHWDGSNWKALGPGLNGAVWSLAFNSSGELYAGGNFANAGGDNGADKIAKWDGNSWSALGSGLTGTVTTIAFESNGALYVGGDFIDGDGNANLDHIAHWNGTSWSALGTGLNGDVDALAIDSNGLLYVGGNYTDAGGNPAADFIAQWDGISWFALGVGLNDYVRALEIDSTDTLYVGGHFTDAGGNPAADHVAIYNNGWSALGLLELNKPVRALAVDSADALYVGGRFTAANDNTDANQIAKWDRNTSTWTDLSSVSLPPTVDDLQGLNRNVDAIVPDGAGNWFVGGSFIDAGGNLDADNIVLWDGNSWAALNLGLNEPVSAMAVDNNGVLYVAGSFTDAGGDSNADYIAQWNGSNWSALGSESGGFGVDGISALALNNSGDLIVGGLFSDVGGNTDADNIVRWDGSSWQPLDSGLNSDVFSLAFDSNGELYAGGSFSDAGGDDSANGIAHWNGSNWSGVGMGLVGHVYALAIDSTDTLYAGGVFLNAGGDADADYIAQWNGSSWAALGKTEGAAPVYSLTVDSTDVLYVGGVFTDLNGIAAADYIARYDNAWSALGTGLIGGNPRALAVDDTAGLMVGGVFRMAGSKASQRIAHWREPRIMSPSDGTALEGKTQVFSWSASGASVTEWEIEITDAVTNTQLYIANGLGTNNLSTLATGLPIDGRAIAATLSYRLLNDNTWYSANTGYLANTFADAPVIYSPIAGSTLRGAIETFRWSTVQSATAYRVWLGDSPGSDEYGRFASIDSSVTTFGLPTDGRNLYATLKWYDGIWHTETSFIYVASTASVPPTITSPLVSSSLSGSNQTFQWTAAQGATTYRVWIGSTSGGDEYGRFASIGTSVTASELPTDGSTVYATLKWFDGNWHTEPSLAYVAFTASALPTISSPAEGSTLSGSRETFHWTVSPTATTYRIWLGSSPGGDEYGRFASINSSVTISGLPTDGSSLYATLKWFDGIWHTETAFIYFASTASAPPTITSPVAGSSLSGLSETFQWTVAQGASSYRIWLGSTYGGDEYGRFASTGTSVSTSGLPADDSTVFVTLKWFDSRWHTEASVSYISLSSE